mmetsp:Transcript_12032/g.41761  ORF Transcript_12032/g.41761 Transcript_12032/m.41761 type:complete len:217 (-) Transcript_12032:2134-2784(-)
MADAVTAGSCTLLLQSVLPCCVVRDDERAIHVVLRGGTNVAFSPPIDYTIHVALPLMRRLTGMEASVSLKRRGFFPRGGGEITLTVSPKERLAAFRMLERGDVVELQGIVLGSEQTLKELQSSLLQTLREEPALGNLSLQLSQEVIAASVSSAAVVIWAKTEGGCVLGASALSEKRVNPHQLAGQAVESLRESLSHGGCVDEHMQDQANSFASSCA